MIQQPPTIMIHGGFANELTADADTLARKQLALTQIIDKANRYYMEGNSAVDTATYTVGLLEENPLFNAGLGSRIQKDGHIRQSASLMDGVSRKFASITNIEGVLNPSKIVRNLWGQDSRKNTSLAPPGVDEYAQDMGYMPLDYNTLDRVEEWRNVFKHETADDEYIANGQTGTVGCVICAPRADGVPEMVAMTSTGGTLKNRVGRVSDSSSPAGNFASENVAVSMTGNGEEIVNYAIASSIAALVDYAGMSVADAAKKVFASADNVQAGAIIMGSNGAMIATDSTAQMMWARHDGKKIEVVRTDFDDRRPIGEDRNADIVSPEMLDRARNAKFDMPTAPLDTIQSDSVSEHTYGVAAAYGTTQSNIRRHG